MNISYESIFLNEKNRLQNSMYNDPNSVRVRYFLKLGLFPFKKFSLLMCPYEKKSGKIYTKMLIAVITGW